MEALVVTKLVKLWLISRQVNLSCVAINWPTRIIRLINNKKQRLEISTIPGNFCLLSEKFTSSFQNNNNLCWNLNVINVRYGDV